MTEAETRAQLCANLHTFPNGRTYRLTDHGEYVHGEYPKGGIHIATWEPRCSEGAGGWVYVSNSPDAECARNFLDAAKRLPPLNQSIVSSFHHYQSREGLGPQ